MHPWRRVPGKGWILFHINAAQTECCTVRKTIRLQNKARIINVFSVPQDIPRFTQPFRPIPEGVEGTPHDTRTQFHSIGIARRFQILSHWSSSEKYRCGPSHQLFPPLHLRI